MSHRQTKCRAEGRRRRSGAGGLITAGVLAGVVSVPALAGPQGEHVVHGHAHFLRQGNNTTITTSNRAIINYDSFNLNRNESVRFVQPGAQSRVLNRITSDVPTHINGSIFANGNVYFVNRAGIYFGQNAVINVGGIYAAAGNMSNRDFLNNVNRFTDLQGEVVNQGQIVATREAHLVGRRVANFGSVVAPAGLITMSAGDDVLLGERGGRVFARISGDASNGGAVGVENRGVIDAGSGRVIAGVGDHFALALYDTSVIRGANVRIAGGAKSTVKVSGSVDATSDTGRGGSIDVLGGRIGLYGADLDASGARAGGEIHIGGDYQGVGDRLRSDVTLVDAETSISVDATARGHAGRAIVWSDGATVFRGEISGKGQNKGGFAEVSSLGFLDFNGTFDLSGGVRNGTLLLDPKNIFITATDVGGATVIGDVDDFSVDPSATTNLHDDLLSSWLNGGVVGDVMLKANNDIVFAPFSEVVQNAGETNNLRLFAGRRIAFAPNSSLVMGGGSLFAVANAVNEVGFVAADRDPGQGSIFLIGNSRVEVQGAGQIAEFTIDAVGGNPGSFIAMGELLAPTININAIGAQSQVLIREDGNAGTTQIGLGSQLNINAGNRVVFFDNAGVWSFGGLDVTSPETIFDANASGVTASIGSLRFAGSGTGLRTDTTGLFTLSGPASLETSYTAFGGVLFDSALSLGADIAAGGMEFQGGVTLTDDVALTLNAAGNVLFGSTVGGTTGLQEDLTVNLGGLGDLTFAGQVGDFVLSLGEVAVNGLTGSLAVNDFFFANSLTSASGAGNVALGNDGDVFILQGSNANGNALEIDAARTDLAGSVLANAGNVQVTGLLGVSGDSSIGTLALSGQISLDSVLLDASGADANLTLNTFAGADIMVADGAGETVTRDAGGANNADLNINSFGGAVALGDVISNGAAGNVLRTLEIQAGAGAVDYIGTRYAAQTLTLNASAHNLADADSVFGDDAASTAVTQSVSFLGGNVNVAAGRTLEMNALAAGGATDVFGVRTNGAGSSLVFRANDTATLGSGDTVGDAANAIDSIDVISDEVAIGNGLFATSVLLDPTSDFLTFGGPNLGGMMVDAGEIANLNLGAIGTLSLGSNDVANFGGYAGNTILIGGTPLTSVAQLDVFGNTSIDGNFSTTALGVNFFGPTELFTNASFQTTNSQVRFFTSLSALSNTSLVDTGDGLISFVNTVPVPGGVEVGAAIDAGAGGGSLTITTGAGGTVTLFDVGPAAQLATLAVDGGTINFRGQRYDAAAQTYTANAFNLLGDGPGTPGNAIAFSGVTPGMNVQTLSFLDLGGGADATAQVAAGVAVNAALDGAFLSEAEILGTGGAESLTVNAGSIQLDRAIGAIAAASRLGSVSLTSDAITVANVFTSGDQTYSLLDNGGAGLLTLNGTAYRSSGASMISFNGFAGDSAALAAGVTVSTGNGGTVNLSLPTIAGGGNALVVNTGGAGTINFAPAIQITNATQSYFGGTMNFLGTATLASANPNATIAFAGGDVNLGGDLTLQTAGAGAGVNFTNARIVLGGSNLLASATGANGGVVLSSIATTGGETVTVRSNGATILNGVTGPGLGLLDLQTDTLAINANTAANTVLVSTFGNNAGRSISLGDDASLIPGTLNLSNASLANLAPSGAGSSLTVGGAAYAGQILVGNAVLNRDTSLVSNGGLVRIAPTGLNATAGMTMLTLTANDLQLGGAIQGAGPFSLALNGPVNVFATADIDTNGGAVTFGDAINARTAGSGFLDVDTSGGLITLREDLGVIGADRTLGRLSLVGSPTLRLTGASTVGDQFFQTSGGAITLLSGSEFIAGDTGDIAFASNTLLAGGADLTVGTNGSISFLGSIDGLIVPPMRTLTLTTGANGTVSLASVGLPNGLDGLFVDAGTVNLGGDVTVIGNMSITASQTLLAGDTTLSANVITLATDIDSAGAPASLTLSGALDTVIQGRLGGNSPLASFTSSEFGQTTLTGGVFSNGLALFRNAVIVSGDATVQSFDPNGSAGIRFLSTIDGTTAGADSLTLIVDRSKGQLIPGPTPTNQVVDPGVPVIALFDSVGTNTALGTLGLNFGTDVNGNAVDGRGFVPVNATIVLGDSNAFFANGATTDIALNVDNLLMGVREKMSVLGSLNATGLNARLGDITTINDMTVAYNAVTILLREAGDVFDPTNGLVAQDSGVDFVAGGSIDFGNITALLGTGDNPEFSQPGGDPSIQSSAGAFLFKSLDAGVADLIASGTTVIDVRADGPTNTNVAEALAGAVPQEQQAEPVVTDVPLSQVALDALVDLGIVIKQPTENLYLIDLPDDLADSAETARVSRRRLEPTLVTTLVSDYDSALKEAAPETDADGDGDTPADDDTISVIRRDAEIKATLDAAWDAFTSEISEEGSAAEFYGFVQENADRFGDSIVEIDRLREVVSSARVLGLTEREISAVKTKMFTMMQPSMGPRVFRDLIESGPAVLMGVR